MTQPIPTSPARPALSPEAQLRMNHQAGDWYVRRQQPQWTAADERALNDWLAQDPAHRAALDGVGRSWADAAQLKAMFPQAYGASDDPAVAAAWPTSRPAEHRARPGANGFFGAWLRAPSLGAALATALLLCVLGGGYGWHRWDNTASFTLDVSTAPGEMRTLDLPDGSQIVLNTGSTLQVRYYPRRRSTVLDRGEAFFQVAPDAGKPFTVDSGASQVRVLGTAFNVRAAPPALRVQVREGRVEVRTDRNQANAPTLVMGPGSGVAIDPVSGQHRSLDAMPQAVGEWRTGQIYFKRAALADVAEELARYLGHPVRVEGAALGAMPVSGLLAVREPERFLRALPSLIDVRVDRLDGGGWRIAPR